MQQLMKRNDSGRPSGHQAPLKVSWPACHTHTHTHTPLGVQGASRCNSFICDLHLDQSYCSACSSSPLAASQPICQPVAP